MIKMYVMHTCPDCEYVEKQVEGNQNVMYWKMEPSRSIRRM